MYYPMMNKISNLTDAPQKHTMKRIAAIKTMPDTALRFGVCFERENQ